MKAKLLRRVRKRVGLYERNAEFYVKSTYSLGCANYYYSTDLNEALKSYRFEVLSRAKEIFGERFKQKLK